MMTNITKDLKELLTHIDNEKNRLNGFPVISGKNAQALVEHIVELANEIKKIEPVSYQNLMDVSKHICDDIIRKGFKTGEYIVKNYDRGAVQAIVDFIDSDMFQSKLKVKKSKIFISHSTDDAAYIKAFVDMLEKMGIRNEEQLFCSSVKGYDIKLGENIYERLLSEFDNYNLYVIYMLSDNYYGSPACLNEMGAAWALRSEYQAILLPKFDFPNIDGAIDPRKISFRLDDIKERSYKLIELKNTIIDKFELASLDEKNWKRYETDFLETVDNLIVSSK